VVCLVGGVSDEPLAGVDRADHGHVVEVRPRQVRIVDDDHLARGERAATLVEPGQRAAQTPWQRAEVHGDVLGLRDQPRAGVEQRARVVEPLLDVGRVGGVADGDPHLLRGVDERRGDDLGGDRVEARDRHQRSNTRLS
jgi:hypothetical protein